MTPEAKKYGTKLIEDDAKVYIIDDEELDRVYKSYPVIWKNKDKKPNMCFIGCPHLTFSQLDDWTVKISEGLKQLERKKVAIRTILTASPDVVNKFKETPNYEVLMATGAKLTSICPLMYTNNPLTKRHAIVTNSNKLRTYSFARYYYDEEILDLVIGKEKENEGI